MDRVKVKVLGVGLFAAELMGFGILIKGFNSHMLGEDIFLSQLKLGQSQSVGNCCHLYSAFLMFLWVVLCLIKCALGDIEKRVFYSFSPNKFKLFPKCLCVCVYVCVRQITLRKLTPHCV